MIAMIDDYATQLLNSELSGYNECQIIASSVKER